MSQKIKAKVFYSSVKDEGIKLIEISNDKTWIELEEYTKKLFFNKKSISGGFISKLSSKEKKLNDLLNNLTIENSDKEKVKSIFDILKKYSYSRSRESKRFWCLMISKDFLIIYHFSPDKSVTFEGGIIKEFVKYLDNSTVNRSIIITNKEYVKKIYKDSKRKIFLDSEEIEIKDLLQDGKIYSLYDRNNSKEFQELFPSLSNISYDQKGDVKIRIKRTDKTDVVIETYVDDLKNINSTIDLNFESNKATVTLHDGEITEIKIAGKKFKDGIVALNYITYLSLELDKFFYDNEGKLKNKGKIIEEKISMNIQGEDIDKPKKGLEKKEETIFIWSGKSEYSKLVKECVDSMRNNSNIGFVEIAKFSENYKKIELGNFSIFAEFDKIVECQKFLSNWNQLLEKLKSINNRTYEEIFNLVGLEILSKCFISKELTEKIKDIIKKYLENKLQQNKYSKLNFKEYNNDFFVIELKSGVIYVNGQRLGFFDNKPEKFAKKIIENLSKKNKQKAELVIYIVGVDETTKEFTLIELSNIRSEFIDDVKKRIEEKIDNFNVKYIDAIPVENGKGILILVLEKK
ncbi:hypothetical protein [Fervidobacterium sp. 2310opik-2]|uniref:hypothetical protein n=1 Tax=Fervidobacterium sp. 2310opik-2 TaxID=1755815 RepID=UPI0013DFB51F|nr:hypothetical protein [Fervidobacterium sp. 2310opik-2]KAF2961354.1 hypothetical protein AS161_08995 [Fervidobacterium sp. 2310opik-2]